jgi:hypothetical protein
MEEFELAQRTNFLSRVNGMTPLQNTISWEREHRTSSFPKSFHHFQFIANTGNVV